MVEAALSPAHAAVPRRAGWVGSQPAGVVLPELLFYHHHSFDYLLSLQLSINREMSEWLNDPFLSLSIDALKP
jgi:hypothetical protein